MPRHIINPSELSPEGRRALYERSRAESLLMPTGAMLEFAGSIAPSGWLVCDGSAVSRSQFSDLFAVLGTTFGVGDGSTTFNLPNRKGRSAVGLDPSDSDFNVLGKTGGQKSLMAHSHTIDHTHPNSTSDPGSPHVHSVVDGGHSHAQYVSANPGTGGTGVRMDYDIDGTGMTSYPQGIGTGSSTTGIALNYESSHTHVTSTSPLVGGVSGVSGAGATNMNPYLVVNFIIKT